VEKKRRTGLLEPFASRVSQAINLLQNIHARLARDGELSDKDLNHLLSCLESIKEAIQYQQELIVEACENAAGAVHCRKEI
jgi:hypothetical protein